MSSSKRGKPRNEAIDDAQARQPFAPTATEPIVRFLEGTIAIVSADAAVPAMHSEAPTVSISDFEKLPPRHKKSAIERIKKSRERLQLSPYMKQVLRGYFQPLLAEIREADLSRMRAGVDLAFSDLVTNKDPGVIASLAAQVKIDLPSGGSMRLAPDPLVIEILLAERKSKVATARTYIGDICLAILMMHEPSPAWTTLQTEYGVARLLALVALDSLDRMGMQESLFLVKVLTDCAIEEAKAQSMQRAKQLLPLEKNRAAGVLENKRRAAEAHDRLRKRAWYLYEKNPTWSRKDVVDHISSNADKKEGGRTYSPAYISRVIKGVRQEWRKDFEARRKKQGAYTLNR